MIQNNIYINNKNLDQIFPFYFVLDNSLIIKEAGRGLKKILPNPINKNFIDCFSFKRPFSIENTFSSIIEYSKQIFIIQLFHNNVLLKGQMLSLDEQNLIIFLGSPWLTNSDQLEYYNILITDFALHDSTPDMLQVLKTQEIVMEDIKMLSNETAKKSYTIKQNEDKYRSVIENLALGLLELDLDGIITKAYDGFCNITGYTQNELIGKNPVDFIYHSKNYKSKISLKNIQQITKTNSVYEIALITKNKEIKWVLVSETGLRNSDQEIIGSMGIYMDITNKKNAEFEIIKAKNAAEQSKKIKEDFLANMSHEIRTPMNAILGMTNILLENKFTQEQKECIDAIKLSSENLLTIINDILDFSKIESGKIIFEKTPFSLKETLDGIIQTLYFTAEKKNIRFYYSIDNTIPEYLIGDGMRLRQILLNLAANAIKFTEQGEVKIEVQTISVDNNIYNLKYSVSDTGIGIPSNKIEQIFESFSQVSSDTTRKYGGTGLGLTIAKQLIELQGGRIAVNSEVNNGSCFYFNLSFEKSTQQQNNTTENTAPSNNSLEGVKILLVEDNAMNQLLAKKIFEKWKCNYDIADNGLIAIDKLSKTQFDIILMDMQMPEMDGYETTQHVRNKLPKPSSQTPIIAMTAHAMVGEEQKCIELGMNDYISKPFNQQNLFEKIKKLIHQQTNNHQTEEQIQSNSVKTSYTDLTYLNTLADGSKEFMIEMIEIFLKQSGELLEKIKEETCNKNWQQVKGIAHKMRPGNEMMGIKTCSELLLNIEIQATEQKDVEHIEGKVHKVIEIYKIAIKELKQELIKLSKHAT